MSAIRLKPPTNWPTDKLSRRADANGKIILTHPHRDPHVFDPETGKWSVEPKATVIPAVRLRAAG